MSKPWPLVSSRQLGNFKVFSLRADRKTSPRTGDECEFFVLECVNWVNVVGLTPADEMVMIEQYRHGTNTTELEIPGGVMDAHETDPVTTAIRELREETGYAGENARIIGQVHANPAILSNTCFTVLIENCRPAHAVEFDQGEDLTTHLIKASEVPQLVANGRIKHSLVVAGLFYFDMLRRGAAAAS